MFSRIFNNAAVKQSPQQYLNSPLCLVKQSPTTPVRINPLTLLFITLITACSPVDDDGDGITNSQDNCPKEANINQYDLDKDGLGNTCDDDIDGDGFNNEQETIAQTDPQDANSVPNINADDDRDGVINSKDKCPDTSIGRSVDDLGCDAKKNTTMVNDYSDSINLNPPRTEPMIPKWALGYMQSGWGKDANGYDQQDNFIDHAKALRGIDNQFGKHKHPADIMILDMYWNGKEWSWPGNMTWDPLLFPDPKAMFDELHAMNFKVMMNYHEGGFGKEWLNLLKRDLNYGLDIVWLDFWKNDSSMEKQVWQLIQEHQGVDKRIMFMARHYARPNHHNNESILGGDYMRAPDEEMIEKSMPVHWTGDVVGDWHGFAESIEAIVYSEDGAMGGWSYLHTDTPGHTKGEDPELASRWIQFSDFSSLTRNHGTTGRDVWSWGPQVEENSYFSRMLRYRLLPYFYTYCFEIWQQAMPLTRPMKLAYPNQRDELRMQYMLGEELLVAPVYKAAADFPDNKMQVYLPAGEQWLDYWSKALYEGGQTITVDVSKGNDKFLPLFVKRGAIIPMGPEIFWIDPAQHADPITLDIYPLANGQSSFTLYDDDGVSMQYQQDHYAQTAITVNASTKNITVTVGATKGDYEGKPETHNYVLKINLLGKRNISQALLNGKKIKRLAKKPDENQANEQAAGWWINPASKLLYVSFTTQSSAENIIVVK